MARSFNGTNDWYGTTARVNPSSGLTYSCWVNPTVVNVTQVMMAAATFSGTSTAYSQFFISSTAVIQARVETGTTNYIGRLTAASTATSGAWQHMAYTWNGGATSAAIAIYRNGTQVDNGNDQAGSFSSANSVSIPTYIGAQNSNTVASPTWQAGFKGSIADVAVWSIALTAAEISALAKGARPYTIRGGASLFLWVPLDGIVTVEPDLSGNASNATVIAGGPAAASGPPIMMSSPRWPIMKVGTIAAAAAAKRRFPNMPLPW